MEFRKAERKKAKLRLALSGPSGSGKTFSALLIAKGIGGRVAMIDTERGSGELYADNARIGMDYDVLQLGPPYHPKRYVEAIEAAQRARYDVAIVDSGSHAWMGEGGMLDEVDRAAKANRGNSMAGWKAVAPIEKKFLEAITGTDIHIIMTLRTKTDWDMQKDEKTGKVSPVKVGLKPEQRQGLEYEFTTVFDLSVDGNVATASKDRTDLFKGQHFVPDEETGRLLMEWLNSGKDSLDQSRPPAPPSAPPDSQPSGQPGGMFDQPDQAPADQAGDGRPARPEMVNRGWNRLTKIAGWKGVTVEQEAKALGTYMKVDITGREGFANLPDDMLAWAWELIAETYGRMKANQEREAA